MKNRIKVNILKKIFCSMLLFIMLSQIAIPSFAQIMDGGELEKTYKEWINIWASIPSSMLKAKDTSKITESVRNKIATELNVGKDISKSMLEKAENQEKIIIKANYKYDQSGDADNASRKITEFNILEIYLEGKKSEGINGLKSLLEEAGEAPPEGNGVRKTDISYDELRKTLGNPEETVVDSKIIEFVMDNLYTYDGEEGTGDEGKYKNAFRDAAEIVVGSRKKNMLYTVDVWNNGKNGAMSHYAIKGAKLPDENLVELIKSKMEELEDVKDEDQGDLGGWLLEPVFMLVNFVFDSLTSVLGEVMNGQDGFLYTKTAPTVDTSTLTNKDVVKVNVADFGATHIYHTVTYTPEEIFSGKIDLLSIDFISGNKADGTTVTNDGWLNIRSVIAQWYKVLRMIAIIGLLSVLIYTGIKIIISANAKDKAKYKEWIINWFIAVAILFSMHYIMAFITSVTGEFSNLISEANGKVIVEEVQSETELDTESVNTANLFETNLMGLVRFRIQDNDMGEKIAYEVMYIALFIYTVKFTFVYLKRVLNMAFLTLIAPIVALTYPIDKLNDGNAQGFNMWLKEYIFNALLQPMHLIMYYILVGSAVSIAASNPLYGIVVLAFMTEAEKLLKKIFGFDKTNGGTVGGMAGAFAAGALASSVKNIAKLAGKGSGGNGGKGDAISQKNDMFDNPKPTAGLDVEKDFGSDDDKTTEQKMFEADEENGEFDDDPERKETLARDGEATPESRYKDENDYYAQPREEMLALGASEEEVDQQMMDQYGETGRNETTQEANEKPVDQGTPIAEMAANKDEQNKEKKESKKKSKFLKGMAGVGKTLAKPVWDFNHGAAYNGKRLARKIGRAALGAGVGLTAAAVQAGISITDGKYNPMEGIATFTAGYAGGGQIAKGIGNLGSAYTQGALQGDKTAIMERAKKRWKDRDDVIAFNKANYKPEEIKEITRIQSEHLLQYGFDLKEMKSVTKYAQQLQKNNPKMSEEAVYNQAAKTLKLKQEVEDRMKGASYDASKQEKYINTMLKGKTGDEKAKLEKAYRNGFKSILAFDEANS